MLIPDNSTSDTHDAHHPLLSTHGSPPIAVPRSGHTQGVSINAYGTSAPAQERHNATKSLSHTQHSSSHTQHSSSHTQHSSSHTQHSSSHTQHSSSYTHHSSSHMHASSYTPPSYADLTHGDATLDPNYAPPIRNPRSQAYRSTATTATHTNAYTNSRTSIQSNINTHPNAHTNTSPQDFDDGHDGFLPPAHLYPPQSRTPSQQLARFARFLRRERWTVGVAILAQILIAVLFFTAWSNLSWEALVAVEATWLTMTLLIRGITEPEVALFMGSTVVLLFGIVSVEDVFVGFSNESVVTIGLMLIIVSAVEDTGALTYIARAVLHKPASIWSGQLRLMLFVSTASAFMNNTPLVAVMIPVVESWTRRANYSVSQFMIPLSYSAIVGGLCTVIGTSTNLIVRGLAQDDYPDIDFPFFEVGLVGVPISFSTILYCLLMSPWLLPHDTVSPADVEKTMRDYSVTLRVLPESPLIGFTVQEGGLNNLTGLYLVEVQRQTGQTIPSPAPETMIQQHDKLTFAGAVSSIRDIWKTKGLVPVTYHNSVEYRDSIQARLALPKDIDSKDGKPGEVSIEYEPEYEAAKSPAQDMEQLKASSSLLAKKRKGPRVLVEVVLALHAPIVGKTVKESHFRARYSAAILSIHRSGKRVEGRIGQICLKGGDTLLLETTQKFIDNFGHHGHFALVSPVDGATVVDPNKKHLYISSFLVVVMISLNVAEVLDLAACALACICVLYSLGILKIHHVRRSLPSNLLLTISGAFGIAEALEVTGVAEQLGNNLVDGFAGEDGGGIGVLFAIYIATVILTSVLSNSAAVTLMYPIADQVALTAGYEQKAAFYIIMLAGSAAFSTPIGYQTNLMVFGPGGYAFNDFVKFGLPLQVIVMLVTVPLCAWFFG
eukprot:TRINITY_DN2525_c0_g11_i2.p1 TRINITY_DN2525_c0_g11~~TRINITY_DN2525_c0_g11_i2.p1  ORF type:complete len:888 (-),score=164.72 TRINITY_DN2525_c0_g11_i2:96-2759(-)